MNEIIPRLIQLPPAVKGAVHPDENGDYIIFINSLYNDEQCREIFRHEMRHILLNHFSIDLPVEEKETQAANEDLLGQEIEYAGRYGVSSRAFQRLCGPSSPPQEPVGERPPVQLSALIQELHSIRDELEDEIAGLRRPVPGAPSSAGQKTQ